MRLIFHQSAEEHEWYARHAFDGLVGKSAPFKVAGVEQGSATVVAVEVDEDQRGATWTVDVPDAAVPPLVPAARGMSFSVPEVPERWWDSATASAVVPPDAGDEQGPGDEGKHAGHSDAPSG